MFCENCGCKMPDGAKFCGGCGALVDPALAEQITEASAAPEAPAPAYAPPAAPAYAPPAAPAAPAYVPPAPPAYATPAAAYAPPAGSTYSALRTSYSQPSYAGAGADTAPLRVGQFIGMFLLQYLPLVNIILLFVWAFGSSVNRNKKNIARAALIIAAAAVVLWLLIGGIVMGALGSLSDRYYY